jgi:hypothetical protein
MNFKIEKYFKVNIFLLLFFASFFVGCSNKDQINPNPDVAALDSIKDDIQKRLYEEKGYIQGRQDGFKEGVQWAEGAVEKYMEDMKALQFTNYLIKEKYIQPGPIYIDDKGTIILSKMEIVVPYTKADIFNKFGGELPRYIGKSDGGDSYTKITSSNSKFSQEMDAKNNEKEKTINGVVVKTASAPLKETFEPTVVKDEYETKKTTQESVEKKFIQVKNTKSNQDLITKFGYTGGAIDDKIVIRFNGKQEAVDFCSNFNVCINTP